MINKQNTLPKIVKEFGKKRMVFDVADMTPGMMDKVKDAVAKVLAEDSIYARLEAGVGQDHKDYIEDASISDPDLIRRLDESPIQHAERIMAPKMDSAKKALKLINAIAPLFEQDTLEQEDIENVPIHEIRIFLFNILNFCDCEVAAQFIPKRIIDGRQSR